MSNYQKPKKWTWNNPNNNRSGVRPTAGARFMQDLPKGEHDLQLYSLGTPSGIKVAIMLEELKALGLPADYDLYKINIGAGDQFGSDFVDINPNSKIPALVDYSNNEKIKVFESGSILLYLAEKFDALIPKKAKERVASMNWLFWLTGSEGIIGGSFGRFFHFAPEALEWPINTFAMESKRLYDVLDKHLASNTYLAGESYSIADIATWAWFGRLLLFDFYPGSYEFLSLDDYPNVRRWAEQICKRPAVQAGLTAEYKPI